MVCGSSLCFQNSGGARKSIGDPELLERRLRAHYHGEGASGRSSGPSEGDRQARWSRRHESDRQLDHGQEDGQWACRHRLLPRGTRDVSWALRRPNDSHRSRRKEYLAFRCPGELEGRFMRGGHSDRSQDRGHGAQNASTGELVAKARIPSIKMQTEPASPVADRPTLLRFFVTDSAASNPIREFDVVHGRRMHLVVVSEDLAFFDHVHPELRDGVFQLAHTFPEAGAYRLWAEATPKGGERALVAFRLRVEGGPIHQPIALVPDRETTKAVMDGQYRVTLMPRDAVAAEKPVVL